MTRQEIEALLALSEQANPDTVWPTADEWSVWLSVSPADGAFLSACLPDHVAALCRRALEAETVIATTRNAAQTIVRHADRRVIEATAHEPAARVAIATLESEREMNALLTAENEHLQRQAETTRRQAFDEAIQIVKLLPRNHPAAFDRVVQAITSARDRAPEGRDGD